METTEPEEKEPEFPPETYRWMSWAAIKFINRPTLRPLAWICYGLLAIMVAAFISTFFLTLDKYVESAGEIVAYPEVLEVHARVDGMMAEPKIPAGAVVAKGDVLGLLQTDMEPKSAGASLKGHYLERSQIRSPAAGTLIQYEVEPNANVKSGQVVAIILPQGSTLVARLPIKAEDLPGLALGQRVKHRLEAFPFQRYGLFEGEVLALDGSRQDNGEFAYRIKATVRNPSDLPPRLKHDVRLVMGMKLNSQIITGNRTLFDIIADSLFGKRQ